MPRFLQFNTQSNYWGEKICPIDFNGIYLEVNMFKIGFNQLPKVKNNKL